MIGYKLTDQNMQTYRNFQWTLGEERTVKGSFKQNKICNSNWLHFYIDPVLAIVMNPVGASIQNPRLFECICSGKIKHENKFKLKSGCTKLTLVRELTIPEITLTAKVAFGILCALTIYQENKYKLWAENWLSGKDRCAYAARAVANTAANTAAHAVANAAHTAAHAAHAADYAADDVTNAAIYATIHTAAARAADVVADYADYAADATAINFKPLALLKQALTIK